MELKYTLWVPSNSVTFKASNSVAGFLKSTCISDFLHHPLAGALPVLPQSPAFKAPFLVHSLPYQLQIEPVLGQGNHTAPPHSMSAGSQGCY